MLNGIGLFKHSLRDSRMPSRWEKRVLEQVVTNLDPLAVGGRSIGNAGIDARIFDARPNAHSEPTASVCCELYESLRRAAQLDGRLATDAPLVKNWYMIADIYSPKLQRFIEIDEYQHFSKVRLTRLLANRNATWAPLYTAHFWDEVYPGLVIRPRRDLDPPHRDEARAYRDEMRERLAVVYGLRRTVRLDEFTLKQAGTEAVTDLVLQLVENEALYGKPDHRSD